MPVAELCVCSRAAYLEEVWCHTHFFWRLQFCLCCRMVTLLPKMKCLHLPKESLFLRFARKETYKQNMKTCLRSYFRFILYRLSLNLMFLLSKIWQIINTLKNIFGFMYFLWRFAKNAATTLLLHFKSCLMGESTASSLRLNFLLSLCSLRAESAKLKDGISCGKTIF